MKTRMQIGGLRALSASSSLSRGHLVSRPPTLASLQPASVVPLPSLKWEAAVLVRRWVGVDAAVLYLVTVYPRGWVAEKPQAPTLMLNSHFILQWLSFLLSEPTGMPCRNWRNLYRPSPYENLMDSGFLAQWIKALASCFLLVATQVVFCPPVGDRKFVFVCLFACLN